VILPEADYAKWLDRETPGESLRSLLWPYSGKLFTRLISTCVKNEWRELIDAGLIKTCKIIFGFQPGNCEEER
jgi:hypothetical protein